MTSEFQFTVQINIWFNL